MIPESGKRLESARAQAKRRQIRDAARRVLVEEGYAAASMDDIAAAASVSKRTLYKYYPGKEALLTGLIYDLSLGRDADIHAGVSQLAFHSSDELEAFLFRIACSIIDNHFQPEYLALVRSVIAEKPRYPQLARRFRETIIEPGYAFLTAIFERARMSGVMVGADVDTAVRLFMGGILFQTYTYGLLAVGEPRKPTREAISTQVHLLVGAISQNGIVDASADRLPNE